MVCSSIRLPTRYTLVMARLRLMRRCSRPAPLRSRLMSVILHLARAAASTSTRYRNARRPRRRQPSPRDKSAGALHSKTPHAHVYIHTYRHQAFLLSPECNILYVSTNSIPSYVNFFNMVRFCMCVFCFFYCLGGKRRQGKPTPNNNTTSESTLPPFPSHPTHTGLWGRPSHLCDRDRAGRQHKGHGRRD